MSITLVDQLIGHEGLMLYPYKDSVGKLTIGVGRNLDDKGITREEALYLLQHDIEEAELDCIQIFPSWYSLSQDQRYALIDMRFNLGPGGFRQFKNMIAAVNIGHFGRAAHEMRQSLWYEQVRNRANDLIHQIQRR